MKKFWFFLMIFLIFTCTTGFKFRFPLLPSGNPFSKFIPASKECTTYERIDDQIFLDPPCVLKGSLPQFSLKDRADMIGERIASVAKWYNSQAEATAYKPAEISFSKGINLYPLTTKRRQKLLLAQQKKEKVWFPLSFFTPLVVWDVAFYASEKDISQLKSCTKHNYLLAFENLDGKVIRAWASFNFNHYLFWLWGYCKGNKGLDLKFYGGVCGVASQLFRSSLTNPLLEIPTRWWHNEWYSAYYGEKVQGDDASVYETSKQLIIKNNAQTDVVIKTFQKWEMTYLILVTDKKAIKNKRVEIQKLYPSPLKVQLLREVYQKEGNTKESIKNIKSELFTSHYLGVTAESR